MKRTLRLPVTLPTSGRDESYDSRVICNAATLEDVEPGASPLTALVCWAAFMSQDDPGPRTYGSVIHDVWRYLCRLDPQPAAPGEPTHVETARRLVSSAVADPRGPLSVMAVAR